MHDPLDTFEYAKEPAKHEPNPFAQSVPIDTKATFANEDTNLPVVEDGACSATSFTDSFVLRTSTTFMVLKETALCEHATYHGGDERRFHRGANGYCRFVSCKEPDCNKNVIKADRKSPSQMWSYLVQVALCTKFGQAARSRELFASVCRERTRADEEQRGLRLPLPAPLRSSSTSLSTRPLASTSPEWEVVETPSGSGYGKPHAAKILRNPDPGFWLYGFFLSPLHEPPAYPTLEDKDLDILQPLPSEDSVLGPGTPFEGLTYCQVSSSLEAAWYCQQTLTYALDPKNALHPETYRFGFYLIGKMQSRHLP
eukprot:s1984_g7.t1